MTSIRRIIASLLAFGTVVVATLSLAGLLGEHARLLELVSHFRVQYLVVATIATLGLAALRRWAWAGVAVGCLILNGALVAPWYVCGRSLPKGPRDLRLLSSNIHANSLDPRPLLELVRREQPDVVVLLEVTARWQQELAPLRRSHPHHLEHPRVDNFGIALYSTRRLDEKRIVLLGPDRVPTIVARLALRGQSLTIVGTHPLTPVTRWSFHGRNRQLADLARMAANADSAFVLAGDLNTSLWSPFYARLERDGKLVNARCGDGVLASWPVSSGPMGIMQIPIDHVMLSRQLERTAVRLGPNIGSDHLPLVVDLVMQGASTRL